MAIEGMYQNMILDDKESSLSLELREGEPEVGERELAHTFPLSLLCYQPPRRLTLVKLEINFLNSLSIRDLRLRDCSHK